MITQNQIAEELGLSLRTVSRYVNGSGYVGSATRKLIERHIRDKGYHPNRIAQGLVRKKTNIIGLLTPSISYSYFPEIIQSIQAELAKNGLSLLLAVSNEDPAEERRELETLLSLPVDGIIICPTSSKESLENCLRLKDSGTAFTLFDRYFPELPCSIVTTDSAAASERLASWLISQGHRDLSFISGPRENSFADNVRAGFMAAMKKAGVRVRTEWIFEGPVSETHGYDSMIKILGAEKRPTAVQAVNDIVAVGAMRAASDRGADIPGEISLCGFSNMKITEIVRPGLTTVNEPTAEIGKTAALTLMEAMKDGGGAHRKIFLEGDLVIRGSCRKI